ncbi:MAG: ATP-binding cassette domain-containing protein [Planctomycetota bacterium]
MSEPRAIAGLELQEITFSYEKKTPLLLGASGAIRKNQVCCLLGASGAGKSTLLRLIAGIERPASGRLLLDGEEMTGPRVHLPPERRGIGFAFQDARLFPHLSAARNVMFGMRNATRRERRQRTASVLDRLGVLSRSEAKPHQLSGGEQQRVSVARALATEPRAMLLDEPFRSLDAESREQTCSLVIEVLRERGVPVLIVTHDAEEADRVADTCWTLRDGMLKTNAEVS